MTSPTTAANTPETFVGMGQIAVGALPQKMKAVVGSCIALTLFHPRLQMGVMAHIVLPDAAGREAMPGKFADTAVPYMLEAVRPWGVPPQTLLAKFAGGASMFASSGPLQIGSANAEAVVLALRKAGIRITAQDTGGKLGRRIVFDCQSGSMMIESAGQPAKTI
jgi:chemotaxis protein CheD